MSDIRTWPPRIWLQRPEGGKFEEHHEVTWCQHAQYPEDVEYVRIDLFNSLAARLKRLEKVLP